MDTAMTAERWEKEYLHGGFSKEEWEEREYNAPPLSLHDRLILTVNELRTTNAPDTDSTKRGRSEYQLWNTLTNREMADRLVEGLGEAESLVLLDGRVVRGWLK